MAQIYEKRKDSRRKVDASLIYQINLSGDHYSAKKFDHSSSGISFKGNYDLKPGTTIYIRREGCPSNCPGGQACEGCRTVTLATVKWCHQIKEAGMEPYWVGAKYF